MTEHEDPGLKIEDSLMDAVCASARSHGKTNFLESFYTVDPDSLGASRLPWSNRVLQTSVQTQPISFIDSILVKEENNSRASVTETFLDMKLTVPSF